jgi:mono/diheme cytochrome c family protein
MKVIIGVLGTLAFLIAAASIFIWSGVYNVAADEPHWKITHEVLEIARDRSIVRHSNSINAPLLDDPKLSQAGFDHYHNMCRLCHGAPGYARSDFAKGLYPIPPDLSSEHLQHEWKDAQLFWITKHGLKMTGMPAIGETHDDEDIWGIIAFVRGLPRVSPDAYTELMSAAGLNGDKEGSHSH